MSRRPISFETWLRTLATRDDFPSMFGEHYEPTWKPKQGNRFLEHAIRLFRSPHLLGQFDLESSEMILWNIQSWLGFDCIIDDDRLDRELQIEVLRSTETLFRRWYSEQAEYTGSCYMFWDNLVGRAPIGHDLGDTFLQVLLAQLDLESKWCQLSALHGLGHLRDARCRPAIDALIARSSDPEVIGYAEDARGFNVQ
jgi:hypothetical protein